MEGQTLVVDRARRAGEMEDDVDRLVEEEGLREVVVDEAKVLAVIDVLHVLGRARIEVVHAEHSMPVGEEVVAEMGAEEARSARHYRRTHLPHDRRIFVASSACDRGTATRSSLTQRPPALDRRSRS
jgi:hypothetical protein